MKNLIKEFIGKEVHVHMKNGKVYANMTITKLDNTAFVAKSKKGAVHIIQYEEVSQLKME